MYFGKIFKFKIKAEAKTQTKTNKSEGEILKILKKYWYQRKLNSKTAVNIKSIFKGTIRRLERSLLVSVIKVPNGFVLEKQP